MLRVFFVSTFFAGVLTLIAGSAHAFQLTPVAAEFEPSGPRASQTFRVTNDSDEPTPVQITMVSREMDIDGVETFKDAEDEFVVFPPQIVLAPRESRTIRIQWVGDPAPKTELAYRIIAEQLPVALTPEKRLAGKVRLLVRYQGSVYIVPRGVQGNAAVEKAEAIRDAKNSGATRLAVTVSNTGTAHALLQGATLTVQPGGGGAAITLSADRLKGMIGENVLAGHSRRFILPWPTEIPVGPVSAALKIQSDR